MKCGIIGSGVIGNILAAYLAKAGNEVYVVDIIPEIIEAINEKGLEVSGVMELSARVAGALPSTAALVEKEPDCVFITLKAFVLPKILDDLKPFDNGKTTVVSFQNGIDTEEVLARAISREHALRGVINYAGVPLDYGKIKATFFNKPNYLGALTVESHDRAAEIAAAMTEAGLDTEAVPGIKKHAWRKTILNSCLMPTSVITRLTMDRIMGLDETKEIVRRQIVEFLEVARAEGYEYEDDFLDKAMGYLANAGSHRTSMLLDFEAGRPLELDFLNGKIQEYADKHGVDCPTNRLMLSLIKGLLLDRDLSKER